jgi:hypothetical protein
VSASLGYGVAYTGESRSVYTLGLEYYPYANFGFNFGLVGSGNLYATKKAESDSTGSDGHRQFIGMLGVSLLKRIEYGEFTPYAKAEVLDIFKPIPASSGNENGGRSPIHSGLGISLGLGIIYRDFSVFLSRSPYNHLQIEFGFYCF